MPSRLDRTRSRQVLRATSDLAAPAGAPGSRRLGSNPRVGRVLHAKQLRHWQATAATRLPVLLSVCRIICEFIRFCRAASIRGLQETPYDEGLQGADGDGRSRRRKRGHGCGGRRRCERGDSRERRHWGMSATAGATATAGSSGDAGGGAVTQTAGGGGTGAGAISAGGAGIGAMTAGAGSGASAPGTTTNISTSTGAAGIPATAGGSTASTTNPIGIAGSGEVTPPSESDDGGGCRVGRSSTGDSGPTAAFALLLGLVIRSVKRRQSSTAEGAARQRRSR